MELDSRQKNARAVTGRDPNRWSGVVNQSRGDPQEGDGLPTTREHTERPRNLSLMHENTAFFFFFPRNPPQNFKLCSTKPRLNRETSREATTSLNKSNSAFRSCRSTWTFSYSTVEKWTFITGIYKKKKSPLHLRCNNVLGNFSNWIQEWNLSKTQLQSCWVNLVYCETLDYSL